MKYIKNTGRIALAFTIVKNGREVKISFDRRRLFRDSGNIATDGITPIEEEDIKELKKQKLFNDFLKKGDLEILEEKDVKSPEESKISQLEDENKELKAKLEEASKNEKPDVKKLKEEKKAVEDENKTLADENASLKAQLEALTKDKSVDENADADEVDTAGF